MAMEKIYTHSEHTNCYTYFCIKGDFDPEVISEMLGLVPNDFHKIGDKRKNGTAYDFASWQFGICDHYDIMVENQMMKTISPLIPKMDALKEIIIIVTPINVIILAKSDNTSETKPSIEFKISVSLDDTSPD